MIKLPAVIRSVVVMFDKASAHSPPRIDFGGGSVQPASDEPIRAHMVKNQKKTLLEADSVCILKKMNPVKKMRGSWSK